MTSSGRPKRSVEVAGKWRFLPLSNCCEVGCIHCEDETASACLDVEFSSIYNQTGGCSDCYAELNGQTWRLGSEPSEDDCCIWRGSLCSSGAGGRTTNICGFSQITAKLCNEGSEESPDYVLTVMLQDLVQETAITWRKSYGSTKPDCDAWDEEELAYHNDDNACCRGEYSTCKVTATSPGQGNCTTGQIDCSYACDACEDSVIADRYQVTLGGGGCEDWHGTYIIDARGGCGTSCGGGVDVEPADCIGTGGSLNISFTTNCPDHPGKYVLWIFGDYQSSGTPTIPSFYKAYGDPIDCVNLDEDVEAGSYNEYCFGDASQPYYADMTCHVEAL